MLQSYAELRELHTLIEQSSKWLSNQLGGPICIENCGRCCKDNTPTIHSIEASYILSFILGSGDLKIVDWCRGWLLEHHSCATIYNGMPHGVVKHDVLMEWNALQRSPCILLTPDNRCMIHKFEPLPCAAWGVLKAPAMYCPRPLGKCETENNRAYVGSEPALLIMKATKEFKENLKKRNPDWAQMGFLPTMIFRQAREKEFRQMIADNKIASAKLIGTDYSLQSLFQAQVDAEMGKEPVNLIRA